MSTPVFLLATDLDPREAVWAKAARHAMERAEPLSRVLGWLPRVRLVSLMPDAAEDGLAAALAGEAASELFVLPIAFDTHLGQRHQLGELIATARRQRPEIPIHHDDIDPTHPLLVQAFAEQIGRALAGTSVPPQRLGLLLAASGHGDSGSRASSYRLMRLLWEETRVAQGEAAFLRHAQPFLRAALERCGREPLHWVVVPQAQWETEHVRYARLILGDHQRAEPEAVGWRMADPPGAHPAISAWLEQRMFRLWQDKRAREAVRVPSARSAPTEQAAVWDGAVWQGLEAAVLQPTEGVLARVPDVNGLRDLFAQVLPRSDWYAIKVTWHGYATGTFTSPATLDRVLSALPGRAIIVEGHTSSRNTGGAAFDWELEAQANRAWIAQQDAEYLQRTGLADVMAKHGAQYVNVTEAWWNGDCVTVDGLELHDPGLAAFVPRVLWERRGIPFLSLARWKGPTRLGISNLFGLLPPPLRSAYHGPNITHFARVCCEMAKVYGSLFPLYGVVEAFDSAVRWNRQGLYRSRWGHYDLVPSPGLVTTSAGLVGADVLASRMQGQDIGRSGYFDVVRSELGMPEVASRLPEDLVVRFAG